MKVIGRNQLSAALPIHMTVTSWLLLDRFQPAQWVWGAVGAFVAICWIACIYVLCKQEIVKVPL